VFLCAVYHKNYIDNHNEKYHNNYQFKHCSAVTKHHYRGTKMGFRIKLGKIAKSEREKYCGKSHEECLALINSDEELHDLDAHDRLYEIGKDDSFHNDELTPFYSFDLREYAGAQFFILSKEGLIKIIQEFETRTAQYYSSLFEQFSKACNESNTPELTLDKELAGRIASNLMAKRNDWCNELCSNVRYRAGGDGEISSSESNEYAIFNLVHILKTFDFDNDYLIYSGW